MTENTHDEMLQEESSDLMKTDWVQQSQTNFEIFAEDESKAKNFQLEADYFDEDKQEDKLWMARTGLDEESLCGAVETLIFLAERPISVTKMKSLIDEDLPLRVIHQSLERLQREYEDKHHGIRLVEVAEGYQFRTKSTYSRYVQDALKINSIALTPAALEVLSIIAYKQPVSRPEIDRIRGVDSSHLVRVLMDKRLVKITGRSEEMGRPVLFATTMEFLEVFNLSDLSALPPEDELKETVKQEGVSKISDLKTIVAPGDRTKFIFNEEEELQGLSSSIKAIEADTPFTRSLKLEDKKRLDEQGSVVKTAFDLLEEHVALKDLSDENRKASASELVIPGVDPKVIQDILSLGNMTLNAPDVSEDAFEMIDLDTGRPVNERQSLDQVIDNLLSQDVESAFSRLIDEKEKFRSLLEENEPTDELASALDAYEEILDEQGKNASEQAEELDMDLSFLRPKEDLSDNSLLQ